MNSVLFIGATGLRAQQTAVDVLANNIANINTPAYKRASVNFSELVAADAIARTDALAAVSASAGLGVSALSTSKNFSPGELRKTENALDIAIRGNGFIELMSPGGQTVLWRGASLRVNPDGFLAASNGMQLKASISVPNDATSLLISENGAVAVTTAGNTKPQQIGQIELIGVGDARALAAIGDGMYRIDDPLADVVRGLPGDGNLGLIQQGFAETANVNLSDEMVAMLLMQRAYTANARVIQVADDMMATVNQLRR